MPRYKKRKDNRYHTSVTIKGAFTEDGLPKKYEIYGKSQAELEEKKRRLKNEIERGGLTEPNRITVAEYSRHWLKTKAHRETATRNQYENSIEKHIIPELGGMLVSQLTEGDIVRLAERNWHQPRTAQLVHMTMHQIVKRAIKEHTLKEDICLGVELPRYKSKPKRALTKGEKERFLKATFHPDDAAIAYLLYGTGMRPEELRAIKKRDISNDGVTIREVIVYNGNKPEIKPLPKTDKGERTVPIPASLRPLIAPYTKNKKADEYLFTMHDKTPLTKTAWYHRVKRIAKAFDADKDLTAYVFRHNYATILYYSGISIKKAADLMGHADINMIMKIYAHLDEEKENAAEKIDAAFK